MRALWRRQIMWTTILPSQSGPSPPWTCEDCHVEYHLIWLQWLTNYRDSTSLLQDWRKPGWHIVQMYRKRLFYSCGTSHSCPKVTRVPRGRHSCYSDTAPQQHLTSVENLRSPDRTCKKCLSILYVHCVPKNMWPRFWW